LSVHPVAGTATEEQAQADDRSHSRRARATPP
jgi:hypothetical protein